MGKKPVMKIKQVQEVWTPKWKWFNPPKWFIFKWAFKIDINSTICDYESDQVVAECTIQKCNVKNKNGRTYPSKLVMEQISHSNNASQVQIGIVRNFYGEIEEEEIK